MGIFDKMFVTEFSEEEVEEAIQGLLQKGLITKTLDGDYELTSLGISVGRLLEAEDTAKNLN